MCFTNKYEKKMKVISNTKYLSEKKYLFRYQVTFEVNSQDIPPMPSYKPLNFYSIFFQM